MKPKSILIDITKCIGCKACDAACKSQNELPEIEETKLTATAYTVVEEYDHRNVRRLCMHCKSPACESVCLVRAFTKTEIGAVVYDSEKCIGCRYCMLACPFQIPKYEWSSLTPKIQKCKLCYEKILEGGIPACVEACPVEAAIFGDYESLIQEAHRIIKEYPDKYVNYVYGEKEAGGTTVLYISDVEFNKLGFKVHLRTQPFPDLTWKELSKIPSVVLVGAPLLYGIWWITKRRKVVAEYEQKIKDDEKIKNQ